MVCATKVLLEVPADLKILNIYLYTIDALAESAHFDYNTTFLRSHKISWDLTISTEVSQDLLRYHKIYWDLKYQLIWHSAFNFDTWHLTFDIDMLWHLTIDIWHWNWITWHSVMILAQTYLIFIDGFWGNISNLKTFSQSVNNTGLRDASTSKNDPTCRICRTALLLLATF